MYVHSKVRILIKSKSPVGHLVLHDEVGGLLLGPRTDFPRGSARCPGPLLVWSRVRNLVSRGDGEILVSPPSLTESYPLVGVKSLYPRWTQIVDSYCDGPRVNESTVDGQPTLH